MPQAPGMEIHPRLREECGGVEVVGIRLHDLAHGVAILLGRVAQVGSWIGGKPQGHGRDVGPFAGRSAGPQVNGFLNCCVRLPEAVFAGRVVVVGPDGFGNSPEGHGEFGIEFARFLK